MGILRAGRWVARPCELNNWGDAERVFGGLDSRCEASYALQEFYQQGGSTAYVVRIGFTQAEIVLTAAVPAMTVSARAGGPGGNTIAVGFSHNPDGSFDMVVSPSAASHADRRVYTNLTATPGTQGFAEARVNAPEAQGGSPLVTVASVAQVPAETVPGTAANDIARADLVPLANGVAVASASLGLPNGNPRITATAIAPGVAGNAVRIALRHNGATNFDLLVRADAMSAPELFEDLSMVAADPRFVEAVVNTGSGGGAASALLIIGGTNGLRPAQQLPPGFPGASPLTDVQYADMIPLAGGLNVASASAALMSGPQPALTLQAFAPGAGGNALTVAVADQGAGLFRLTFAGIAPGAVFDNLTIDPTSADYVVARLAGSGIAAVVTGRHQLLVPAVAAASAFSGGGAPVPTASADFLTAAAAPALTVTAANPGAWGNALRIGIGAAAGGAFDLVVTEFLGEDPVRSEAYRNLNAIPGDRNNAVDVIAQQSGLIRIDNLVAIPAASVVDVDADDLARLQMTPLTGGADGVMPGDPAWQAAAPAAFAGSEAASTGMRALDRIVPEIFNLMAVPEAAQMADPGAFYGVAGGLLRRQSGVFARRSPHRQRRCGADYRLGYRRGAGHQSGAQRGLVLPQDRPARPAGEQSPARAAFERQYCGRDGADRCPTRRLEGTGGAGCLDFGRHAQRCPHRSGAGAAQQARVERHAGVPQCRHGKLGGADAGGGRRAGERMEVCPGAADGAFHREIAENRPALGGFRAQ